MGHKPKTAWAFWANMNGPWWKKPQRVILGEGGWWHRNQDAYVTKMGLVSDPLPQQSYLTFASVDKKEVRLFIEGFLVARRLMANFTNDS